MAAICAALSEELCVVAGDELDEARTTGWELLLLGAEVVGADADLTGADACFCWVGCDDWVWDVFEEDVPSELLLSLLDASSEAGRSAIIASII